MMIASQGYEPFEVLQLQGYTISIISTHAPGQHITSGAA